MTKLSQVLAQEDTVLFIGSGISMWSGLPSWSGLIEELAQFVELAFGNTDADLIRSEAEKGDLLQAASYGFDKLTKQQIGEFIRKVCRYGSAQPHEIHRKIVSLGPRCFITTNYDNLIEESLRKWLPDTFFRPAVTNRQLTETAEIVSARALNFIFKPHGDVADSESIILTREQYRQMLPGGERQAALESMKMLLASRPVVYFGFGLRDPDFLFLRDVLANTYKGGTRDHYAVMADITSAEIDYWRRNYGIHLVGYRTIESEDKRRDHTPLLGLLDSYLENTPATPTVSGFIPDNPDTVLALARYSAGLARTQKSSREFKLRIHVESSTRKINNFNFVLDKFDHFTVNKFLDGGPERALLIGLPGAGKSYSLRQAAARFGEKLHDTCLAENFDKESIVFPIFVDLKLYQGSLNELVNKTLPSSLPLNELTRHFKVKVFIDSFNEMPREYLESGSYEPDFEKFINEIDGSSFVIGSRTSDGLVKFELPVYSIDQIDEEALTIELKNLSVQVEGRFNREVRSLLQRPFYFQYVANGIVTLPKEAHPRDFYQSLFDGWNESFGKRFGGQIDIEKALSLTAYDALNRGEEAFPLSQLLSALKSCMDAASVAGIDDREIANWLVSFSILIPYTGGRVAFVHQSVTEYLAAKELARLYQSSPHLLKEKLGLTRWDQALFLTLSLLPPSQAESFLQSVIEVDFVLAMNASKYLEYGREEVVSKLLAEMPNRISNSRYDWKIQSAVKYGLPITESHEQQLRTLIERGESIGGAAVLRLVDLKGAEVKADLMPLLVKRCHDYNFCVELAHALEPFVESDDARRIALMADSLQEKLVPGATNDDDPVGGFIAGASRLLHALDLSVVRQALLPLNETTEIPKIRAGILSGVTRDIHSEASLEFAGELLIRGVTGAAFSIYMISEYSKDALSWASFTKDHVERLLFSGDKNHKRWEVGALKNLCAARRDLASIVEQDALKKSGIEKATLLYCLSPNDSKPVFESLRELLIMRSDEREEQPVQMLEAISIDWAGHEDTYSQLLELHDTRLLRALLGSSIPARVTGLGKLKIGPIDEWLQWISDADATTPKDWVLYQLGGLFSQHLDEEVQQKFITEFNNPASKYRQVLLKFVLPNFKQITTDMIQENAISFLLANLAKENARSHFWGPILGAIATEKFINERLLPLLPSAQQPLLKNLHDVLKLAGERHGRRYLLQ